MKAKKVSSWFPTFAKAISRATGRTAAFALAGAVIVVWVVTGPLSH